MRVVKSLGYGRIDEVKDAITHWMMGKYPNEFKEFFVRWMLLNLYYNETSKQNREVDRVLEFGKKHEILFNQLKDEASKLVCTECVGRGLGNEPPDKWVKTATLQLRKKLGIDANVCDTCRSEKRQECQNVETVEYEFGCMEALMRVLYQVRCNLFHGDKTNREEFQMERNQSLVRTGNRIIAIVLNSIMAN